MRMTAYQNRRIKKKVIMKCLLLVAGLSTIYFVIAGLIGLPGLYVTGLVSIITTNLSLLLPPWVKRPRTKRKYTMIVEDPTGKFSPEMKQFKHQERTL